MHSNNSRHNYDGKCTNNLTTCHLSRDNRRIVLLIVVVVTAAVVVVVLYAIFWHLLKLSIR